ncbi:MAG: rubrerythrin family protein [Clostridiales bacterium]|nr:rubrerythrin family protein [Clostridiales bacterium]
MELKGSRTEANLMTAFAGESQARNKYTFYGATARKEGYQQIGDLFDATASNEKEHAELWFKYLHDGGKPNTLDSLIDAAAGEHYEWTEMYKEFADIAQEEGFTEIAATMRLIAKVEKEHEERFQKLVVNLKENKVFTKDGEVVWVCRNCGYVHVGKSAPGICPACKHPQAYFEVRAENY